MKGFLKMAQANRGKQGTRKRRNIYVIVCEGTKTEPNYFKQFKTKYRYNNLNIKMPDSGSTDPKSLVRFAREQIKTKEWILDLKNGDAIWCVFDCDENTDEAISQACNIAKNDVKICFSNPSFEIWYLLHYELIVTRLERWDTINKLKKHIPDYEKSKDIFDLLSDRRSEAIANSKKLNKNHMKNKMDLLSVESNPSTQVYTLVEDLLKFNE